MRTGISPSSLAWTLAGSMRCAGAGVVARTGAEAPAPAADGEPEEPEEPDPATAAGLAAAPEALDGGAGVCPAERDPAVDFALAVAAGCRDPPLHATSAHTEKANMVPTVKERERRAV
ncbi:MAG: hypothetical protein ABI912_11770 [Actinomycetota bacterium]